MLSVVSGYICIDRAWNRSPDSPLYGARRRTHYAVFREIAAEAVWDETRQAYGIASFDLTDVARLVGVTRSTVSRCVDWLAKHGLITVESQRPMRVKVTNFEKIRDMRKWLKSQCLLTSDDDEKIRATSESIPKAPTGLENTDNEKPSCNERKIRATNMQREEVASSNCNDLEKEGVENLRATFVQRDCHILKDTNSKELVLRIFPTDSPNTNQNQESIDDSEAEHSAKPSEFDLSMAKLWADKMAAKDKAEGKIRFRRFKIGQWSKTVMQLRTIDGWTEDEIRTAIEFKFADEFYSKIDMGLGNLRRVTDSGRRKSDNLIERALSEKRKKETQETKKQPAINFDAWEILDEHWIQSPSGEIFPRSFVKR